MPNPSIFGKQEIAFLTALGRERVDFMIVGLSAAALQGAPVVTQDVDLWFRDLSDPGIQRALHRVGGSYVASTMGYPPMFAGRGIQLFDIVMHMHGLGSFDEECANTIRLSLGRIKVRVLRLERIIANKKATNRENDRLVLAVLSDTLATIRSREK